MSDWFNFLNIFPIDGLASDYGHVALLEWLYVALQWLE